MNETKNAKESIYRIEQMSQRIRKLADKTLK